MNFFAGGAPFTRLSELKQDWPLALLRPLASVAPFAKPDSTVSGRRKAFGWPMLGSSRDLVDILARVALRDKEAFKILYDATNAKLYGVILKILTRRGLADEILQDVYIKVWEKAGDFDPLKASPITWLATIARNRALDELRRQKVMPTSELHENFDVASDVEDAFDTMERTDRLKSLVACLNGLDKDRRDLVLLAYYRGLSREALAQRSGRPVATIKTWLHRSLIQLRVCLAQ